MVGFQILDMEEESQQIKVKAKDKVFFRASLTVPILHQKTIVFVVIKILMNYAFFANFSKTSLCFRLCSVRLAAVELLARNGTQMEPRLRINGVHFKTLHSIGAGKSWKMSSFFKTRHLT